MRLGETHPYYRPNSTITIARIATDTLTSILTHTRSPHITVNATIAHPVRPPPPPFSHSSSRLLFLRLLSSLISLTDRPYSCSPSPSAPKLTSGRGRGGCGWGRGRSEGRSFAASKDAIQLDQTCLRCVRAAAARRRPPVEADHCTTNQILTETRRAMYRTQTTRIDAHTN